MTTKPSAASADAANIVRAPRDTDIGRWLEVAPVERGDLEHPIGNQPEREPSFGHRNVEHEDGAYARRAVPTSAELGPQIDHRHAPTANIDQAEQIGRCFGNPECRSHVEDFDHDLDRDPEYLAADPERDELFVGGLQSSHGSVPLEFGVERVGATADEIQRDPRAGLS